MKKLLFISSRPLYPIIGGDQIRTVQSLNFLKKYFDVHVLIVTDREVKEWNYEDNYTISTIQIPKVFFYIKALNFIFNKLPIQVNCYTYARAIKYVLGTFDSYDIIFCNNIRTAEYARKCKNIVKIIDFVDAISMNYEKAYHKANILKKLLYFIDYKRCLNYEKVILNEFNAASIISNIDREYIYIKSLCQKTISLVGNMVEIPAKINKNIVKNQIIFIGKMSYDPNIVAVINFVKNIFPIIKKTQPNATFYIIGACPSPAVKKLSSYEGVYITGYVDDITPYFGSAAIVVAPMLSGAGIQNKIIQAMAHGCCVITTPIGAEGLNIKNEEIAIEKNNQSFAEKIIDLLSKEEVRNVMGKKAAEYVEENMKYNVIENQFKNFISPFI